MVDQAGCHRIGDAGRLTAEKEAGSREAIEQGNRNPHHVKADWQFTTDDVRVKLKHLYRQFE